MKRLVSKHMKKAGWESVVEWAFHNNMSAIDMLDPAKMTRLMSYISTLKLFRDIEYSTYRVDHNKVQSEMPDMIGIDKQLREENEKP